MKKAWTQAPPTLDGEMSLEGAYPPAEIDAARRWHDATASWLCASP